MTGNKQAKQKPKTWQWWVEKVVMPLVLALISGYILLITSGVIAGPDSDKTPQPLKFTACVVEMECPEVDRIGKLFPEDTEWDAIRVFETNIPADKPVRFSTGWCTKEESTLKENLEQLEFVFTINGVSYVDRMKFQYDSSPDGNDETQTDYCYRGGTVVSNWQPGQQYHIQLGILIKEDINDGWKDYFRNEKRYSNFLIIAK